MKLAGTSFLMIGLTVSAQCDVLMWCDRRRRAEFYDKEMPVSSHLHVDSFKLVMTIVQRHQFPGCQVVLLNRFMIYTCSNRCPEIRNLFDLGTVHMLILARRFREDLAIRHL